MGEKLVQGPFFYFSLQPIIKEEKNFNKILDSFFSSSTQESTPFSGRRGIRKFQNNAIFFCIIIIKYINYRCLHRFNTIFRLFYIIYFTRKYVNFIISVG